MNTPFSAVLRGYARLRLRNPAVRRALPRASAWAPSYALLRGPLQVPAAHAERIAMNAAATHAELGWVASALKPAHARRALRAGWGRIPEAELARMDAAGGFVLALPLGGAGLAAVAMLATRATREVLVLKTAWSEGYLARVVAGAPARIRLCSAQEMVRHRRESRAAGAEAAGYVTFPDHHMTSAHGRWRVSLFGEEHYLPILEGLLLAGGAGRLHAPEPAEGGGQRLAEGPEVSTGREIPTADLGMVADWLAARMEAVLRQLPGDALAWRAVLNRSVGAERHSRQARVSNLRCLLRVWQTRGPALPDGVHDWSQARLAELEAAAGIAGSALNVPSASGAA